MSAPQASPSPTVDGRVARSRRTRLAIVDALRTLHAEGDLTPTVGVVAERAGISRRTVWQHFDDLETLFVEAGQRDVQIARSLTRRIDADQPLGRRIEQFAAQRARLYEALAPSWRAGRLFEHSSEQIRRNKDVLVDAARREVVVVFATELRALPRGRRHRVADAVHAASLWATWDSLRTEVRLSPEQAQTVVATTLTALLAGSAGRI